MFSFQICFSFFTVVQSLLLTAMVFFPSHKVLSRLLKVYLHRESRLLLSSSAIFFHYLPICLLKLKVQIYTGKGKIPSAHAHLCLLHCLSVPVFPWTPNVSSTNIYSAMKHSSVATQNKTVGV